MRFFYYIPGILSILFGLIILTHPEILVVMVSGFFFMMGIVAIGWASRLRRFFSKNPKNDAHFIEVDFDS